MGNKRLRWSLYDTFVGPHDKYNPRYVYRIKYVPEISYLIAKNPPYSLSKDEISKILEIDINPCVKAIESMLNIKAISMKGGKYRINFPAFIEDDLDYISDFSKDIGKVLGERIIGLKDEIDFKLKGLTHYKDSSIERLRYHVIGCDTLDGGAIEEFSKRGLLTTSKSQPGGRDYLIIGYEESEKASKYSNKLLCSCNIFNSDNIAFGSFGDGGGSRKDMMRFFRRLQGGLQNVTEDEGLNLAYLNLLDDYNKIVAKQASIIMINSLKGNVYYSKLNDGEKKLANFLEELGYISCSKEEEKIKVTVPVFQGKDSKIIDEISNLIVENIYEIVKETIKTLDKSLPYLTSVIHGVDFKDIANELWHLMFGPTNEYLVKVDFFSKPEYKKGEGRYLQALYIY